MLTSIRGLCAASFATAFALSAAPAMAEDTTTETTTETATIIAPVAAEAVAQTTVVQATVAETAAAETTVVDAAVLDSDFDRAVEQTDADKVSYVDDEGGSGFELSGNVALVSEYRFRGVDLSGGDIAVQGGVDLAHSSGFYVGTWGSSLDEDTVGFGHTELDLYGGWSGDLTDGISADVGVIAYMYPNAGPGDFDYVELYGSVGFTFGPAEATVGVAYAPEQDSLGSQDNFYIYADAGFGIPGTPLSATAHLGYTDGFLTFTNDSKAFDWSIGVEMEVAGPVSIGVAYVGAEGDIPAGSYDFVDDAVVFTLSASI
jgi:uncharacterized protein (TIGR02001 family)